MSVVLVTLVSKKICSIVFDLRGAGINALFFLRWQGSQTVALD